MPTFPDRPESLHCPLCGQPNQCALAAERTDGSRQGRCWCCTLTIEQAVLDSLAPSARGQACVCQACARGTASGS